MFFYWKIKDISLKAVRHCIQCSCISSGILRDFQLYQVSPYTLKIVFSASLDSIACIHTCHLPTLLYLKSVYKVLHVPKVAVCHKTTYIIQCKVSYKRRVPGVYPHPTQVSPPQWLKV